MLIDIVDPLELGADINRPGERTHRDFQFVFQFVENIEGVAPFAVELVDEDNHRSVAHTADLHQLPGLLLHTFGHVHHDDDRVNRRQGAVGVFGEVLVTRSVEDVDFIVAVIEAHDGSSDGNTPLLLDFHPVGGGGLLYLVGFHGTGHVDGTSEKEEFLGQRGLSGVGMGNNGKRAAAGNFFLQAHSRGNICWFIAELPEFPGDGYGYRASMIFMQSSRDSSQWGISTP